eukprot:14476913-Heterocapsa_arctica.AAC.1
MAVPLGGLPDLTKRGLDDLLTAVVNGPRQTSADAEFRRKIKENLQHRFKWDAMKREEKVQRASDGCS